MVSLPHEQISAGQVGRGLGGVKSQVGIPQCAQVPRAVIKLFYWLPLVPPTAMSFALSIPDYLCFPLHPHPYTHPHVSFDDAPVFATCMTTVHDDGRYSVFMGTETGVLSFSTSRFPLTPTY